MIIPPALLLIEPELGTVIVPTFVTRPKFVMVPVSVILPPGLMYMLPELDTLAELEKMPVILRVVPLLITNESPALRVKLLTTHTKLVGSQFPPSAWHELWSDRVIVAFAS